MQTRHGGFAFNGIDSAFHEGASLLWLLTSHTLPSVAAVVPVVFGCELQETGELYRQNADGLMGLGLSQISIPTQLAAAGAIDDGFALCFGGFEGNGYILLGDFHLPWTHNFEWIDSCIL